MMYHLKKDPPKTKPVVLRQRAPLYLTANKRPSVILKNSNENRHCANPEVRIATTL